MTWARQPQFQSTDFGRGHDASPRTRSTISSSTTAAARRSWTWRPGSESASPRCSTRSPLPGFSGGRRREAGRATTTSRGGSVSGRRFVRLGRRSLQHRFDNCVVAVPCGRGRTSSTSRMGRSGPGALTATRKRCWPHGAKLGQRPGDPRSARILTPRSMSLDIKKSAGTMPSQPPRVSHQGLVIHRDRKWKRVRRPSSSGVRTKAHDQSSDACARQLMGR